MVRLNVSDACDFTRRLNRNTLATSERAARERARNHRADAPQGKYAVYGQPRFADVARGQRIGQNSCESSLQIVEAKTANNGCRNNRSAGEGSMAQLAVKSLDCGTFIAN